MSVRACVSAWVFLFPSSLGLFSALCRARPDSLSRENSQTEDESGNREVHAANQRNPADVESPLPEGHSADALLKCTWDVSQDLP